MKNLTILGGGVLGAQIALQFAAYNNNVVIYDISHEALASAKKRIEENYLRFNWPNGQKNPKALDLLDYQIDLATAVKHADIIIEAVPENIALKETLYTNLNELIGENTILATNTSTLSPTALEAFVQRKENFLAYHFANDISYKNIVEICRTAHTSDNVFDTMLAISKASGLVPILLKKEKSSYLLNSMLVPWLEAASELYIDGYAEPKDIDLTWKIATGAEKGPFEMLDLIGFNTVYNIQIHSNSSVSIRFAEMLKRDYIDKGKLGMVSGEGFYRYQ